MDSFIDVTTLHPLDKSSRFSNLKIRVWDSGRVIPVAPVTSPEVPPPAPGPILPVDHCYHRGSTWGRAAGTPPGKIVSGANGEAGTDQNDWSWMIDEFCSKINKDIENN